METCKFLVSGDVRGHFKLLFSKVEKSIKKCGPFAFLLCTGSFFGEECNNSEWEYYKCKPNSIPIQVYVLGPNSDNEAFFYSSVTKTSNINEKITFVGKSGIFTTCEGIKVAYISGLEKMNKSSNLLITDVDVRSLISRCITVDILFTTQWPMGITNNGMIDYEPKFPAQIIVNLIKILKPRYLFSGWENKCYERIPLCHVDKDGNIELLTRFVGLAFVGNSKEKWLYAVNMDLQRKLSISDAEKIDLYLKFQPNEHQYSSHVLAKNTCNNAVQENPKEFKERRNYISKKIAVQENCWFCLCNVEPQNHLIISVGLKVYLSLSKGGLVKDHMCLIPINHVSCISQIDEDIRTELDLFKNLIKQHYKRKNKKVIFYERFYRTLHAQVNCIPVVEDVYCNVKASFMERAAEIGLNLAVYSLQKDILKTLPSNIEYFHAELDNDELFCKISPQSDFPLNFGREALVKRGVFNCPEKSSWKNCILELDEEKNIVYQLRKYFQCNKQLSVTSKRS